MKAKDRKILKSYVEDAELYIAKLKKETEIKEGRLVVLKKQLGCDHDYAAPRLDFGGRKSETCSVCEYRSFV